MDEAYFVQLFKYFQVVVPKINGCAVDFAEIKRLDFLNQVNHLIQQKLFKILNQENGNSQPDQSSTFFKFCVGFGNNSSGIRQIIKRRSWWHKSKSDWFLDNEENEGVHFIWTQWKQADLIQHLKAPQNGPKLIYNRLEDNFHLANKKALFMNMCHYY